VSCFFDSQCSTCRCDYGSFYQQRLLETNCKEVVVTRLHMQLHTSCIYLLTAVTLGGAYVGGKASPVGLLQCFTRFVAVGGRFTAAA